MRNSFSLDGNNEYKLLSKRFHKFIISIQKKNFVHYGELLHEFFKEWKGNVDQIDDVCVLGMEV